MVSKRLLKLLNACLGAQKLDTNFLHHIGMQRVDHECLTVEGGSCFHIVLRVESIGFDDIRPSISRVAGNGAVCRKMRIPVVGQITIGERNNTPDGRIVEPQLNGSLCEVTSSIRLIVT